MRLIKDCEHLRQENSELRRQLLQLESCNAELMDKALSLQKNSEAKSLFFSNMTHEFRTPLHSATSLVRMLLERQDGDLTSEQERQVVYIQQAIEDLTQMVNDLLDTARLEAGKLSLHLEPLRISEIFKALQSMFRPLLCERPRIQLIFTLSPDFPLLYSDEAKVAQILRNLISNALKYTETGVVHVAAHLHDAHTLALSVSDSGIGIADEDQSRIFEDFVQLSGTRHGTGLGLPLCRRLALLLGGSIRLKSVLGEGSTFSLMLPRVTPGTSRGDS